MSNTPISSVIRTASTISTLTETHCCHPCTSTLVVARKRNRMFLLDRNQLSHWFVEHFATGTIQKGGVDQRCWNHNGNICWALRSHLFGNAWLSISLKVQHIVQRLIGILKLGLCSINLERNDISLSSIRKIRANHLGSNLCLGAKAQLVHHAIQMSQQLIF